MGVFDKIKKFVNANEDDYYDETAVEDFDGYVPEEDYDEPEPPRTSAREFRQTQPERSSKVVNINQQAAPARQKPRVVLAKPSDYSEAKGIADHLKSRHMVVLNLEDASRDVARRLVDFLGGVAYANSGDIQRVANSTFIITPHGYDVMGGDIVGELENSGVFFR